MSRSAACRADCPMATRSAVVSGTLSAGFVRVFGRSIARSGTPSETSSFFSV
jgi:hypothetical protein